MISPFLGLNSLKITDLRDLLIQFTGIEHSDALKIQDKNEIISRLINSSEENTELKEIISRKKIAFKPGFFLLHILSPINLNPESQKSFSKNLQIEFEKYNSKIVKESKYPARKDFEITKFEFRDPFFIFHLTWTKIHWYWSPNSGTLKNNYEMRVGYLLIRFDISKAMVICQNQQERDIVSDSVSLALDIELQPVLITKPILNQIGSFDKVKKAGYYLSDQTRFTPKNITYADDNLSIHRVVQEEEMNPSSIRMYSFYQIPLLTIEEQGVGVNSDSGKLWIPKYIPSSSILDYGIDLLNKIHNSLNDLVNEEKFDDVINTYGLKNLDKLRKISPVSVRKSIVEIIQIIINMIFQKESQRQFPVMTLDLIKLIPKYFQYAHIQITDSKTGEIGYLRDENSDSIQYYFSMENNDLRIHNFLSDQDLDTTNLTHPLTGNQVEDFNLNNSIELLPTNNLIGLVKESIALLSSQFAPLRNIEYLNFYLTNGRLIIKHSGLKKEKDRSWDSEILPESILRLRKPLSINISKTQEIALSKSLSILREKCNFENDDNCSNCLKEKKYICLRSLIGRYFDNPQIFPHKGTELSDFHGSGTIVEKGDTAKFYGFAKRVKKGNLTARNAEGSILFSQIFNQIFRTTYNSILVITPNVLNEDLRDNLLIMANLFNKNILYLDRLILLKIIADFEEQTDLDMISVKDLYKRSYK